MSSLTDPIGGMLNQLVEAQRGMTDAEAIRFLQTGELPDLSQPPVESDEPEPATLTEDEALRFLAGEPLVAAAGFSVPSSLHYDLTNSEVFKFNPRQPRDGDGRWTETPGGGVDLPKVTAPTGKKVVPAIIYKKHSDGTVVAQRGNRRLRWDAGVKKFVAEERSGDGWVEREQLTKTAAYNEMKNGEWTEADDDDFSPSQPETSTQTSSQAPESTPAVVEPTDKNGPDTAQIPPGAAQNAVDSYRAFAHAKVNRQLRTGKKEQLIGGNVDEVIAGLDEAMAANELDRDVAVWRGMNVSLSDLTPGTVIEDPAFVSTSLKRDQAEVFARMPLGADVIGERSPILMRIRVPKGTRALNFGGTEGEGEVLLDRGLRYRITGTVKAKDYTIVNAEVTHEVPIPAPTVQTSVQKLRDAYDAGFTVDNELHGGNSTEFVQILTLSDGTKAVRKKSKPQDYYAEDAQREYLSGLVAEALGIPDTAAVQLDDRTTLAPFIEGESGGRTLKDRLNKAKTNTEYYAIEQEHATLPNGKEIGMLDWLINNPDRHNLNWMITPDGRVQPIDHGNAHFVSTVYNGKEQAPVGPFVTHWLGLRTTQFNEIRSIKPKFTKAEITEYRHRLQALEPLFAEAGRSELFTIMMQRLDRVDEKVKK